MPEIAKVVVGIASGREFDYLVPAHLRAGIRVGCRVSVPFRSGKRVGFVVGLADESKYGGLKSILSLMDSGSLVDDRLLELAHWIADYYCAPLEHAIRAVLPAAVRREGSGFKRVLFVSLTAEGARRAVAGESGGIRGAKQAAALAALSGAGGGMFLGELSGMTGVSGQTVRALEKKGLVTVASRVSKRNPWEGREMLRTEPLTLMPQQAVALETIIRSADTLSPPVVLLHGVTGSGKTEVYLQAIDHVLAKGRGAIVLVPEISLTPQAMERFRARFGDSVAVLHSRLSEGERHDEWHRIREGKARIAIGARSAVFAPVAAPGIIIVDEEHDGSYKQEESPRYSARDVAVVRGRMCKCSVLLGSATPSLESCRNAGGGKYALVSMPHRVDHRRMPVVRIVDMRVEAEQEGRVNVFSRALVEAVKNRIEKSEQTILFLNRRGYATSLVCPKCGYVAECGQCSVAMTYHKVTENLRCHVCGRDTRTPPRCPKCGDPAFRFTGMGTQRIESVVSALFPGARTRRMDSDSTGAKDAHRSILGEFRTGKIDILIGTQMIAKGLDFPNVTLIGVIYADLSLHVPDFRAGERTFQLLTQVAGRAGRGDIPGEVIVQTYTPFHYAVQCARRLDYDGFFEQELAFRREMNYPPFSHLVCITAKGPVEQTVTAALDAFSKHLRGMTPRDVVFSETAPAPLARAKGEFRRQLILRTASIKALGAAIREARRNFKWPAKVTCSTDVDAVSLM